MATKLKADASPEKRLFIALLTRDIGLADAFLDLIDNSLNAAIEPLAGKLRSASGYLSVLGEPARNAQCTVEIFVSEKSIRVIDDASGISHESAQGHTFKFGKAEEEKDSRDRLSVYGIGLKRAFFKMGNEIRMRSDHVKGGFDMDLNVRDWELDPQEKWQFDIKTRAPVSKSKTGTEIEIRHLHDEVRRRLADGVFVDQLKQKISRTYALYLDRVVRIEVNGTAVEPTPFRMGRNNSRATFKVGEVSCAVAAGIAIPNTSGRYLGGQGGWFIFCNGRNVIYGDTTTLSGWTGPPNLPLFQPKHRPFLGLVFFYAEDPEALPWTTTKSHLDVDSIVWQETRKQMIVTGKSITSILDGRYREEGTQLSPEELATIAGEPVNALRVSSQSERVVKVPSAEKRKQMKIQYYALEPIREVIESDESDVIPLRVLDSRRSIRCGHPNTAARPPDMACAIRAI